MAFRFSLRNAPEALTLFRIADGRYPIASPDGARLYGSRWTSPGIDVVFASQTHACAMLEVMVHVGRTIIPAHHRLVRIAVPRGVSCAWMGPDQAPAGWDEDAFEGRVAGDDWVRKAVSAVLLVPSVISRPDWNAVLNPAHAAFRKLRVGSPESIQWDARLFGMAR